MKERPKCEICGSPALVFMFDKYFCGDCVVKWDKINKEEALRQFKEVIKNGS